MPSENKFQWGRWGGLWGASARILQVKLNKYIVLVTEIFISKERCWKLILTKHMNLVCIFFMAWPQICKIRWIFYDFVVFVAYIFCDRSICVAVIYSNSPVYMCVRACTCACVRVWVCVCVCYTVNLKNLLKISLSKFNQTIVPLLNEFQSCSKNLISCRNVVAMATIRNYKKKIKKSSSKDHQDILHKALSIGPLPRLFKL